MGRVTELWDPEFHRMGLYQIQYRVEFKRNHDWEYQGQVEKIPVKMALQWGLNAEDAVIRFLEAQYTIDDDVVRYSGVEAHLIRQNVDTRPKPATLSE